MFKPTNFEIYWHDLAYAISPKITINSILREYKSRYGQNLTRFNPSHRSKKYDINRAGVRDPTEILQNVCGSFRAGQITAVIGPSGAGKTSLLNFLSRRRDQGYSGHLHVKNTHRTIHVTSIPQDDIPTEYLTVRENLLFASRLKNPSSDFDHESVVKEYSKLLDLDDCLDTRTGNTSGGQQKRLSIAQELMSKPDVLILDEPTSGLDSSTCYKTLSVLRNLVKASEKRLIEPVAILLTIHQPEEEVFELFDKVYGLANGGRVIYDGPPGGCAKFIERYGGLKMPDDDYNPASFLIEVASGELGQEPIEALERQVKSEFYLNSISSLGQPKVDSSKKLITNYAHQGQSYEKPPNTPEKRIREIDTYLLKGSSTGQGRFWSETCILSSRCWLSLIRDPKQAAARVVFSISFPIFLAIIVGSEAGSADACPKYFSNFTLNDFIGDDELYQKVQEEYMLSFDNGITLFQLLFSFIGSSMALSTLSFALDCKRCLKESSNGWYSTSSYLMARLITDLPMDTLLPFVAISLGFMLTGQAASNGMPNTTRIAIMSISTILGSMIGQTMGMIIAVIFIGRVTTALFLSQAITIPLVLLSGSVIRLKEMSQIMNALSYLSFFKYSMTTSFIGRYGYNACDCDPRQFDGRPPRIVDIPQDLTRVTWYWMNSLSDVEKASNSSQNQDDDNIFQLFARQVSLYRTYGMRLESCEDVMPFQLHDSELNERMIPGYFFALVLMLVSLRLILVMVVKYVLHLKAGL